MPRRIIVSPEQHAKIEELYDAGLPLVEIAAEVSFDASTVSKHVRDLPKRSPKSGHAYPPDVIERIRTLYAADVTLQDITRLTGVHEQTVIHHTRDLPRRLRKVTEADRLRVRRLYLRGDTYKEIEEATGVPRKSIARITADLARRRPDIYQRSLHEKIEKLKAQKMALEAKLDAAGVD